MHREKGRDVSEHITSKQYRDMNKPRGNKFNAKKVRIDGHTFDSKREGQRYATLKQMQDLGLIESLELQPAFPIIIDDKQVYHENGRKLIVKLDFRYRQNGKTICEDAKGMRPRDWSFRKAIVEAMYGIKVVEV